MFIAGRLLSTYQAFNKYFLNKYCLNPPQNYKLHESRDFECLIYQCTTALSVWCDPKKLIKTHLLTELVYDQKTKSCDLYETQTYNLSPMKVCTNEPQSFSMHTIIKSHSQAKISRKVKY